MDVVAGDALEGGRVAALIQPEALVIVLGGTLAAVTIQNTWAKFVDALRHLRMAFVKTPQVDQASLAAVLESIYVKYRLRCKCCERMPELP